LIEEAPDAWRYGPIVKEQKRLGDFFRTLKGQGLCGTSIVGAYHVRMLMPLMARALPMYKMTLDIMPKGTVMVTGEALSIKEMA